MGTTISLKVFPNGAFSGRGKFPGWGGSEKGRFNRDPFAIVVLQFEGHLAQILLVKGQKISI
jgi:hypothetical protein